MATGWQKAKRWVRTSPKELSRLKAENARRNRREGREALRAGKEPNPPGRLNDRDIS